MFQSLHAIEPTMTQNVATLPYERLVLLLEYQVTPESLLEGSG